ncbi:MAG: Crp/Fnr family transcriptional regulator [Acidimicrobiales bacterium]|nr:Crp/Fnr family transcriptional regulator [Acidimicrobiales bacterium]
MPGDPLGRSWLFAAIEPAERRWLHERSSIRHFRKGQLLFVEGDPAEWILVVTAGRLKVSTFSPRGDELILDTVEVGQTVGELGVLARAPRSASVEALTDGQGLSVPASAINDLLERRPEVARSLLLAVARHVYRATGTASDLAFLDLPRRVAKYLLERWTTAEEASAIDVGLSQRELAARLGASRQRVNAALAEFQRRGWITLEGQKLSVRDPRALEKLLQT